MFIGHFAVGFASKRWAPDTSLGILFAAVQGPDLLWPVFLLLGIEQVRIAPGDTAMTPLEFVHYPWSHSLVMVCVWAVVAALLARSAPARDARAATRRALVVAAGVLSHWCLDAATHRPDLPLLPGGTARAGLDLWRSVPATVVVESLMYAVGVAIYLKSTRPLDGRGRWLPAALAVLLAALYAAAILGPPPPSVAAIAWTSIAGGLLFLALAAWADRHRVAAL
ncbi:MAG TPA: hypothetical protein VFB49_08040 [Patescibacteria group bacterium]|nr:hypothetical protein [Patescibacteria group bacterium]